MKRGDVISPILFSILLNDLAKDIKNLNLGVEIEPGFNVSILLFADDIVLLSPTEEQLQLLLNFLSDCRLDQQAPDRSRFLFQPETCNFLYKFFLTNQLPYQDSGTVVDWIKLMS